MQRFFKRFSYGELPLNRIEAFSDGVFAIIITLLVLELKVPYIHHYNDVTELANALIDVSSEFLSWLISFIILGKFWINHHHILQLARYADYSMIWINLIFLMFQSFIPFPTALMGEYPTNSLAVSFYGVVMIFNILLFIALHAYIVSNLLKPEAAKRQVPEYIIRKSFIIPALYLLGAISAWNDVVIAFLLYTVTPFFFIVPPVKKG